MTAKWIDELLTTAKLDKEQFELAAEVLSRINTLLCIAGDETDNEFLHEDIMKEVEDVVENSATFSSILLEVTEEELNGSRNQLYSI